MPQSSTFEERFVLGLRLIAAAILGQTLYFKFAAAPESVYIFSTLGVEPWGRLLVGALEAITVVLLLLPRTPAQNALGALLGLGLMAGAIGSHLTKLGIEVQGDGGLLFALACGVALVCAVVLWLRRAELPIVGARFRSPGAVSGG